MEIKTITARIPTEFDRLVNEALAEGWTLVKRDVLQPWNTDEFPRLYYAELERDAAEEAHVCVTCRHSAAPLKPDSTCKLCHNYNQWEAAK